MSQDLMETLLTKDGFWKSKHVRNEVSKLQGYKNYPETEEAIWILKKEVIRLNSRNCYIGPQGRGIILMDEIKICNGKKTYVPFRNALFVFIDLLIGFHKRMTKRFGQDYLKIVSDRFSNSQSAKAFFGLYEAHIGSRSELAFALEQVGRKGISFQSIGDIKGGSKSRDCGIGSLVEVTTAIEKQSLALASKDREIKQIEISAFDRNSSPRAIVKIIDGGQVAVSYNHKDLKLTKKESLFMYLLFEKKGVLSFREIWDGMYPNLPFSSAGSGIPSRLRSLKMKVKQKLKDRLGSLPNNADWITTSESYGYSLNQDVVTWSKPKDYDKLAQNPITNYKNLKNLKSLEG